MDLTKYKYYTAEGFANEEGFWLWVLEDDEEQKSFWLQVLKEYPEKQKELEDAKRTVLEMNTIKEELPAAKVDELWNRISTSTSTSEPEPYTLN